MTTNNLTNFLMLEELRPFYTSIGKCVVTRHPKWISDVYISPKEDPINTIQMKYLDLLSAMRVSSIIPNESKIFGESSYPYSFLVKMSNNTKLMNFFKLWNNSAKVSMMKSENSQDKNTFTMDITMDFIWIEAIDDKKDFIHLINILECYPPASSQYTSSSPYQDYALVSKQVSLIKVPTNRLMEYLSVFYQVHEEDLTSHIFTRTYPSSIHIPKKVVWGEIEEYQELELSLGNSIP